MPLPIIAELRAIKSEQEIKYIKLAQYLSERVLVNTIKRLTIGCHEIEIAQYIIKHFKQLKIKALAFEPIVAFGKSTADIHHQPNQNKLKLGDTVMLDFGATINGYCSDMTRTLFFGLPNNRQVKIYNDVLLAQTKALKKITSGERVAGVIDNTARRFLNSKYRPQNFPHGLGHGVGTAIHEWPTLKPNNKDLLKPNMVITIEPGLYFKNWGGVRIEDMVLINKIGIENLTRYPKDLKSIILKAK